jgi:hypothetical protein
MGQSRLATLAVLAGCLGGLSMPEAPRLVEPTPVPEPVQAEKMARAERKRQARAEKRAQQALQQAYKLQPQKQYRYNKARGRKP